MRARVSVWAGLTAASFGVIGCDDPLVNPSEVIDLRVIAAQTRVDAEPERAQPVAGEAFTVQVHAVDRARSALSGRAHICDAQDVSLGVGRCDGGLILSAEAEGRAGEPLSFAFQLPDSQDSSWLLAGALCEDSTPRYDEDAETYRCAGGAAPHEFFFVAELPSRRGSGNLNPDLTMDELQWDGQPWTAPDPEWTPGQACDELDVPSARQGREVDIAWELGGEHRESLEVDPDEYGALDRESLLFSHMATLPGLSRPFSSIVHDDEADSFELSFEHDEAELPRSGRLQYFYTVVRDGRGGTDVLQRAFCALP